MVQQININTRTKEIIITIKVEHSNDFNNTTEQDKESSTIEVSDC